MSRKLANVYFYADMEKVFSSLAVLAEKSRKRLKFGISPRRKFEICLRKTFHFFHVCCVHRAILSTTLNFRLSRWLSLGFDNYQFLLLTPVFPAPRTSVTWLEVPHLLPSILRILSPPPIPKQGLFLQVSMTPPQTVKNS